MFEFLGRGKGKTAKKAADSGPSTMPQTVQLGATQIEVLRMTLHGVLKLHGIPGTWVTGEVVPVHIPGQGEALLLQLEIQHWNDALVLHAPAFEQAMLNGLKRFDPQGTQTRYLFAWKFSPHCGCPHTQLPEPGFWSASETVRLAPIAAATQDAHVELPLGSADHDDHDDDDNGFAPTQLHDIR